MFVGHIQVLGEPHVAQACNRLTEILNCLLLVLVAVVVVWLWLWLLLLPLKPIILQNFQCSLCKKGRYDERLSASPDKMELGSIPSRIQDNKEVGSTTRPYISASSQLQLTPDCCSYNKSSGRVFCQPLQSYLQVVGEQLLWYDLKVVVVDSRWMLNLALAAAEKSCSQ